MDRFEVWFGGLFLGLGLLALLVAGLLYVALAPNVRTRSKLWAVLGAPIGIGIVFSLVGAGIAGYGLTELQKEERLRATGTLTHATVTELERTSTRVNGRSQWRAHYEYRDQAGRTHQGASSLLSPGQVQMWSPGDQALIRYDPADPTTSIWLGREEPEVQFRAPWAAWSTSRSGSAAWSPRWG